MLYAKHWQTLSGQTFGPTSVAVTLEELSKIMLPPRREHDFHKIAVFTFVSNFDPKWVSNPRILTKNARGETPKSQKWPKQVFFGRSKFELKFGTEENVKK